MPAETEFKLRAAHPIEVVAIDATLREAGVESRAGERRLHVDLYLDDMEHSLTRAGIGLRLRLETSGSMLCCKTRGSADRGLFVREEHECEWSPREAPGSALELPPPLRARIEPFTLDRKLSTILRLETRRETRLLRQRDQDLCELAIDYVEASGASRSTTFFEIELEVLDDLAGSQRLAELLLQALPLQMAPDDKPTHAAACLGLSATTPTPPGPGINLPDAVLAMVGRQLERMRRAESLMREIHDPVHLHTMRVELRRLRCLVRAFETVWVPSTAAWLLEQLASTGRRLGALRDLDVMIADLPRVAQSLPSALHSSIDEVQTWLRREREETNHQLLGWMSSPDRLALEAEIERRLLAVLRPDHGSVGTLGEAAPAALLRSATRLKKRIAATDFEQPAWNVHELRVAGKNLRYLIDSLSTFVGHEREKTLRQLVRLQQELGGVRDHELASDRMLAWLSRACHADQKAALLGAALGALAATHTARARKGRKRALECLRRIDRKRAWRRLGVPAKT